MKAVLLAAITVCSLMGAKQQSFESRELQKGTVLLLSVGVCKRSWWRTQNYWKQREMPGVGGVGGGGTAHVPGGRVWLKFRKV